MKRRWFTVKPLVDVACVFGFGRYPEKIRLCMEDGSTRQYIDSEIRQPIPRCGKDGWKTGGCDVVGYKEKPSALLTRQSRRRVSRRTQQWTTTV